MIANADAKLHSKRAWIPYGVLAAALLLTTVATFSAARLFATRDEMQFGHAVQQTREAIEERLRIYTEIIVLGSGLYGSSRHVSSDEFHDYVQSLRVDQRYPGIQGVGLSLRIAPEERESVAARMRQTGFSDFRFWPENPGEECHAILYLEPLDWRNRRAIGYNMFAEPVRRAAMIQARDSGLPAASGKVRLVQETDEQVQPGFLIYAPVYRGGRIPPTVEERRRELVGFVYSPFRAGDLLRGH